MKKIIVLICALLLCMNINVYAENNYDLVITNANVYDPNSDTTLNRFNIGINSGKIAILTNRPIEGTTTIDATDKLVIPSFIDGYQTTQNENVDIERIKDGVTASVYSSKLPFDEYLLKEENHLSYVNRIMLYDFTDLYKSDFNKNEKSEFENNILTRLNEGYAGLFFSPKEGAKQPNLENIPDKYPLYLDFYNFNDEDIIPWLDKLVKKDNKRNYYIISANYHFMSIDNLIGYADTTDNVFFGTFPFSYVNIQPSQLPDEKFQKLLGKLIINLNNGNVNRLNKDYNLMNDPLSVIGVIEQNIVDKMLVSDNFVSESFNHFNTQKVITSDINTFMGRLFLTYEPNNLDLSEFHRSIYGQTVLPKNIFGSESVLSNKAKIETGADADLLIINLDNLTPYSSMTEEIVPSTGIDYVVRNGVVIYSDGKVNAQAPSSTYLTSLENSFQTKQTSISTKGKSKESLNTIIYNNGNYIAANDVADYLKVKYEKDGGKFYIGGIIKMEIGNTDFAIGTNKASLEYYPIIINGEFSINTKDLPNMFKGYYSVNVDDSNINFTKDKLAKLLDKEIDKNSINVNMKTNSLLFSYGLSVILILLFFVSLNKPNKHAIKEKKDERF